MGRPFLVLALAGLVAGGTVALVARRERTTCVSFARGGTGYETVLRRCPRRPGWATGVAAALFVVGAALGAVVGIAATAAAADAWRRRGHVPRLRLRAE